jgi:hypothetical protein
MMPDLTGKQRTDLLRKANDREQKRFEAALEQE